MTRQWWHGFRLPKGGRWRVEVPRLLDLVAPPPFLTWRLGGLLGTLCWWFVPRRLIWRLFAVTVRMTLPAAVVSPPGGVGAAGGVIPPWTSTLAVTTPPPGVAKEAWITATIARAKQAGLGYVFVPASLRPYNAALVTFDPAVRMITEGGRADVYDVRAYGAAGDGMTDDTAAIQAAIQAAINAAGSGEAVYIPPGIYQVSQTIQSQQIPLIGSSPSRPTLKFSLAAGQRGISASGRSSYLPVRLQDLILDLQGTGTDGIAISATDHAIVQNIDIRNAGRDGFVFDCSVSYQWVENAELSHVKISQSGRHGFAFVVTGSIGVFVNECLMIECEVRGVGSSGYPVYGLVSSPDGGAKVADLTMIACNFDLMNTVSGSPTRRIIYLDQAPGGNNLFDNWKIIGGGWENTNDSTYPIAYSEAIAAVPGARTPRWVVLFGSAGGKVLNRIAGFTPDIVYDPQDQRVWLATCSPSGYHAAVYTVSANYVAAPSDEVILANASTGPITITLPPAVTAFPNSTRGQRLHIKKIDASANAVTIARQGTDTIEGATSITLTAQYQSRMLVADGVSTWYHQASL